MMPLPISPVPAPIQPDPVSKVLETHGFSESFYFFGGGGRGGGEWLLEEGRQGKPGSFHFVPWLGM